MSINELVLETLKEVDFEKILKENLKKNIEASLKESIEAVYGYRWGKFAEMLKKELENRLSLNLEAVNIPQYNMLVQKALENEIKNNVENLSKENVKKLVDKFTMGEMKEVYKFSDLLEKLKKSSDNLEENDEITLYIETSSYSKLIFIYFDEAENVESYRCKYRIVLNNGKIQSLKIKETEITNVLLAKDEFEGLLANIFLQGKTIDLDYGVNEENYDLEYSSEED